MADPLFILGSGRCGSTRLFRILSSHPRVAMTNEARLVDLLYCFTLWAQTPRDELVELPIHGQPRMRGVLQRGMAADMGEPLGRLAVEFVERHYLERVADGPVRYWGDKLPNPAAAVAVRDAWPGARYVALVRDPRDVFSSWVSFVKRSPRRGALPGAEQQTAASFAANWRNIYGQLREVPGIRVVRYEDLARDRHRTVEALFDWLELPVGEEVRREVDDGYQPSRHGTSTDVASSVERWRRDLDAADVQAIESTCGPLMERFGYR
jgi:hypothetical protein